MEPVDEASKRFDVLCVDITTYGETIFTEQDTRVKVIDRMLHEVLGWSLADIQTEAATGRAFIDYKMTMSGLSRMIVEAKRDGRDLGVAQCDPGRSYLLNGPVFKNNTAQEGIQQCIEYCGRMNTELACITNGREWIIFRGSRAGDGKDTTEGKAFVFPDLVAVKDKFKLFFALLAYGPVSKYKFKAFFQEAEGRRIRRSDYKKTLKNPLAPHLLPADKLSSDLDKVLTIFFRRLTGDDDPELLDKCFVITKESKRAEDTLARIADDLVRRVKGISTDRADQLAHLIEQVKSTQRNEFVILIGTKGAGKTTFIHRFFKSVLAPELKKDCVVIRLSLADSPGDPTTVADWLNKHLLETAEKAVYGNEPPTFEELKGMFYGQYLRMKVGPLRPLSEQDPGMFDAEFGKWIEEHRKSSPHEYICALVGNVAKSRKKVPCLIFDNADHFTNEFQERVFQYARSIYESQLCLVILPITDRTSWYLSRHDATESFESQALYLPTPSPKMVIERRIVFIKEQIDKEKPVQGRGYFLNKGITLTIANLAGFAASLQRIFIESWQVGQIIANLCNYDIRRCLELACKIAQSPYVGVPDLLKTYVAQNSLQVPIYKIKKAIIRGSYDIFAQGQNKFVQNIYNLHEEEEASPLLGIRILQLLSDVRRGRGKRFIEVDQVVKYFEAMTFERSVIIAWMEELLKRGLCLGYDPTVTTIDGTKSIEISPAGFQHLYWGIHDDSYMLAMLQITPILVQETFEKMEEYAERRLSEVWLDQIKLFAAYLISEDKHYCVIPEHPAYLGQLKVVPRINKAIRKLSNDETI
jgi:hypothetical protein